MPGLEALGLDWVLGKTEFRIQQRLLCRSSKSVSAETEQPGHRNRPTPVTRQMPGIQWKQMKNKFIEQLTRDSGTTQSRALGKIGELRIIVVKQVQTNRYE